MTNKEKGESLASKTDQIIIDTLSAGYSFRVEAGAGAGKTYSLMKVIDWLERVRKNELTKNGQHVACITYTNVAVEEIKSRLKSNNFIQPCTIHNFSWNTMSKFQSSLIQLADEIGIIPENNEKTGKISKNNIKKISYDLGVRYFEEGEFHLHHDDVIALFVRLLDNIKFRKLLSKNYPIILIDEYQDSFKSIMDQIIKYFVESESSIQFGLFGDAWQTIYDDNGACGEVFSDKLKVIRKESNFRSEEIIVNVLNKIRPELPQISALDEQDGRILVITTNDYQGVRQSGYYKDELPNDILFSYIDKLRKKLSEFGWRDNSKTLMITHKMLAKQQHYDNLLNVLGEHLKNADDEHFLFFMNKVEPVYIAIKSNNAKDLFVALGVERRPIQSTENKRQWKSLAEALDKARKGTIYDVLKVLENSRLLGLPPKLQDKLTRFDNKEQVTIYGKEIRNLNEIPYTEVINSLDYHKINASYSTEHGVKGEEYQNVLFVIGRGWRSYEFDKFLPLKISQISDSKKRKAYIRNRNLFYVCCSRAKKRLALFITVPVNDSFMEYLKNVFGCENIMSYGDFMNMK